MGEQVNNQDVNIINELEQEQINIENELLVGNNKWKCSIWNILGTVVFLALLIAALTLFFVYQSEIKGVANEYVDFMKGNPALAIFLFMLAYIIWMPFCIPPTIFILFGAYIFGNAFGLAIGFVVFVFVDYVCLMVGTYLAFLNGRYLFRNWIQTCISTKPKLLALSEALSHNAKKLVFLLRLCALTPYYIFNYVCSITNMSSLDYLIGNTAIILSDAPYIYVWASLSDLSKVEDSTSNLGVWYYIIIAASIVIVIVVIIIIYFLAKKELKKTIVQIQERKEAEKRRLEAENNPEQTHSPEANPDAPPEDEAGDGNTSRVPSLNGEAQV